MFGVKTVNNIAYLWDTLIYVRIPTSSQCICAILLTLMYSVFIIVSCAWFKSGVDVIAWFCLCHSSLFLYFYFLTLWLDLIHFTYAGFNWLEISRFCHKGWDYILVEGLVTTSRFYILLRKDWVWSPWRLPHIFLFV